MTQESSPLKVAIIGSGAAGFFCADYLLRLAQPCEVCMFEKQPTPFGLVRDGVAPDKENIKKVTHAFDRIADKEGFTWFGNVYVGRDISVNVLQEHFNAVIAASGASKSRTMDIQGEELAGCMNVASFAGWYNGRLGELENAPDLTQPAVVIIGAGNAALDAARILASDPKELANTEIAIAALEALQKSPITDIHIVARRGPLQARFSPEELLELTKISGCKVEIHTDMETDDADNSSENSERLQEAYQKLTQMSASRTDVDKRIHFHFNMNPFGIMGMDNVDGVLFMDEAGTPLHIPCGLVITSIGFTGRPVEGFPFDEEQGIIPNCAGRVTNNNETVLGMYAAGWIKRGADGVIGTNKPCCRETVQAILDDRETLCRNGANTRQPISEILKTHGVQYITYNDWKKIDAAEQERGASQGKLRERFTSLNEILSVLS